MKKVLYILFFRPLTISAQDPLTSLEELPQHHELVTIKNKDRSVHTLWVYPEVSEKVHIICKGIVLGFCHTGEAKDASEANKIGREEGVRILLILLTEL